MFGYFVFIAYTLQVIIAARYCATHGPAFGGSSEMVGHLGASP